MNRVKEFDEKLPKFPDGRIDYRESDTALVVTAFLKFGDEILLMKRSDKVADYKERWNTVAGYFDRMEPVKDRALKEVKEETGVTEDLVSTLVIGEVFEFTDEDINKTWIVHPVLFELTDKPEIKLDWEHTDYKWIGTEELEDFDTVPKLDKSLENTLQVL